MNKHVINEQHGDHTHGAGCGPTAIAHDGHVDYAHDGHLHTAHGTHVDECTIGVTTANPSACVPKHAATDTRRTTHMGPPAVTRRFPTGTIRITWSVGISIIPTASTATTMGPFT